LTVKQSRLFNRPIGRIDIVKREINTTLFSAVSIQSKRWAPQGTLPLVLAGPSRGLPFEKNNRCPSQVH
jgi:hypothetical protein